MWVRRTPTFFPLAVMFRFGAPRSAFTSAGSVEVSGLRWMSAPSQVDTSSTESQSPAPMRLRNVCSKSSTSSRSPFQWTVSIGLKYRSRSAAWTFGGIIAGFALQKPPGSHVASEKHCFPASLLHVPGGKPGRPRRSIVSRSDAPNCAKSHVRPSCPPKSAWHVEHVTYEASCEVLTTLPGTLAFSFGSLKRGAAVERPTLFGTLESRAAVLKRILPSSTPGGTGSTDGSPVRSRHVSPPGQSAVTEQRVAVVTLHFPRMLATGWERISGTHSAFRMQGGGVVVQSESVLHA